MNAFIRFAKAMSEQLFTMRSTDLNGTTLRHEDMLGDSHPISQEYIDNILYDPAHSETIKERIRMSVLAAVQQCPDDYDMNGSEYVYSGDIYDNAYLMDHYIEDQYVLDHPEFHNVHICSHCGSDNVQVKAWVRPNQNHKYVDDVNAPEEPGFCDDCQKHVTVDMEEKNTRHKVLGFQVVSIDGDERFHHDMTSNTSLYDTMQADAMIRSGGAEKYWRLKTIWTDDILHTVTMFEGDPQK